MQIDFATPALLLPAISLVLLAYTQRFQRQYQVAKENVQRRQQVQLTVVPLPKTGAPR